VRRARLVYAAALAFSGAAFVRALPDRRGFRAAGVTRSARNAPVCEPRVAAIPVREDQRGVDAVAREAMQRAVAVVAGEVPEALVGQPAGRGLNW